MSLRTYLAAAPKVELHVHLEGSIRPETLLELAWRNARSLPHDTVDGLREWFVYRDFPHFIEVYGAVSRCLRSAGLKSAPHAGETDGPASVRGALEALGADRIGHGVRAVADRGVRPGARPVEAGAPGLRRCDQPIDALGSAARSGHDVE
jgi:adenosine deaminase